MRYEGKVDLVNANSVDEASAANRYAKKKELTVSISEQQAVKNSEVAG